MIDPNIGNTLGLRQMHPVQVQTLMEFIGITINLAALTNDKEVVEETEALADELIRLFGGNGVQVTIDVDY